MMIKNRHALALLLAIDIMALAESRSGPPAVIVICTLDMRPRRSDERGSRPL
jgi:hypothetical protein